MEVKFAHTNIVAKDWQKLAQFYINVFGCEPVYPERDFSGAWFDQITNLKSARVRGVHLRLPGYVDGPTLEIFTYNKQIERNEATSINKPGFAHIAFLVEDIRLICDKLLKNGGSMLGEIAKIKISGVGVLTIAYARDPEGNIVEVQNWN
ncbi:glyoxalase I [Pelotomaculum sp. FP]|uniref:VOC family protein n=1 Tax=Pelotomaculum sp. FP TaxID=261474 RepID=UPI001064CD40|nr:VOC family protein [Pelotomaculum sp. FP]TEB13051.1 glyoxalase I [Pelotomaculum sp. FP]